MTTEQTREQKIDALQRLVNILQAHPEAGLPYFMESGIGDAIYCHLPEDWHATCRAFGAGRKSADDDSLLFFPDSVPFIRVNGFKHRVCEAVEVGEEQVPERIIPATAERVEPAHTRKIVEWRCKPFTQPVAPSDYEPEVA